MLLPNRKETLVLGLSNPFFFPPALLFFPPALLAAPAVVCFFLCPRVFILVPNSRRYRDTSPCLEEPGTSFNEMSSKITENDFLGVNTRTEIYFCSRETNNAWN